VKSLKRRIPIIPANPRSGPGQAPESRLPGENRDPVFERVPDFRRDDVWTPVSTGVTTFYDSINFIMGSIWLISKVSSMRRKEGNGE